MSAPKTLLEASVRIVELEERVEYLEEHRNAIGDWVKRHEERIAELELGRVAPRPKVDADGVPDWRKTAAGDMPAFLKRKPEQKAAG
jgi:hypothetical protein